MVTVPMVIHRDGNTERVMDINSRLLEDRIIKVTGPIETEMADIINSQLLLLEAKDPKADIVMYINSPGGEVTAGMSIVDTMNYITCDVRTVCTGLAASMGSVILMSGAKGKRCSLPNSEIMIHQPSGGAQGKASDIRISLEHLLKTKDRLHRLYADVTGQPLERIIQDMDRDNWMSPEEAKDYGLIDEILIHHGEAV